MRANQTTSKYAEVSNGRHRFIAHSVKVTAPLSFLLGNNARPSRFTFATCNVNRVLRVLLEHFVNMPPVTVSHLKTCKFDNLSFEKKKEIIDEGRPLPDIDLHQKTKECVRRFSTTKYSTYDWLCGCEETLSLYCYPCLLFDSRKASVWTSTGFRNLQNLHRSTQQHSSSEAHVASMVAWKTFGKQRIDVSLCEQRRENISRHNQTVAKNRYVLRTLMRNTVFLAKQGLAFRGNDEHSDSLNRGNYVELAKHVAQFDATFSAHLDNATVFSGLSGKIQNDLIDSIADVVVDSIKSELKSVDFFSIEADEASDTSRRSQLSLIFRYTLPSGEIVEAFGGFFDVSRSRNAETISSVLLDALSSFQCKTENLIAQCYDGAAVMASEINGVTAKIKSVAPESVHVHCFSHQLNLVLQKSLGNVNECRIFFLTLSGLSSFFSSSKRCSYFSDYAKAKFPRAAPTRWSTKSCLVHYVDEYYSLLIAFFEDILEDSEGIWDSETICSARGFRTFLVSPITCFLIVVTRSVFSITDPLSNILQRSGIDISFSISSIAECVESLQKLRLSYEEQYGNFLKKIDDLSLRTDTDTNNRMKTEICPTFFTHIIDNVLTQITERFKEIHKMKFLKLLDHTAFPQYAQDFPVDLLDLCIQTFPSKFDKCRLQIDLNGLYTNRTLHRPPNELLSFLFDCHLQTSFVELIKLLKLTITIPCTSVSVERSFSSMNRIKTFFRNRMTEERLTALAYLSIEKERLVKLLQNEDAFFEKMLNGFLKKDRRIEFMYV